VGAAQVPAAVPEMTHVGKRDTAARLVAKETRAVEAEPLRDQKRLRSQRVSAFVAFEAMRVERLGSSRAVQYNALGLQRLLTRRTVRKDPITVNAPAYMTSGEFLQRTLVASRHQRSASHVGQGSCVLKSAAAVEGWLKGTVEGTSSLQVNSSS